MAKPKFHIGQQVIHLSGGQLTMLKIVGADAPLNGEWTYYGQDSQEPDTRIYVREPEVAFYQNDEGKWRSGAAAPADDQDSQRIRH